MSNFLFIAALTACSWNIAIKEQSYTFFYCFIGLLCFLSIQLVFQNRKIAKRD